MSRFKRIVRVQDTDATGVLYFANLLQMGLEAFEDHLIKKNFSLKEMIENKEILIPIVHAEGDFFAPIYVGDILELTLTFPKIGTRSFTHVSEVFRGDKKVGTTSIIHVFISPKKGESIPIPESFKKVFII